MKGLKRDLGLPETISTVIGIIIGTGIFALPSAVFAGARAPGLGLASWAIGGLITICAGVSVAEMAAAMPKAGGAYTFLNAAYGEWCGFLQGWSAFLANFSGINAALAIIFATYLSELVSLPPWALKPVGIAVIALVTAANYVGVKSGGRIQLVFTLGKLVPISVLIILGLILGKGGTGNFTPLIPDPGTVLTGAAAAVLATLWAYDGWINVSMLAEEIREPQRNLPKAIILGLGAATIVYVLFNAAMLRVMPMKDIIGAGAKPASIMARTLFGTTGHKLVVGGILISAFGTLNGLIMTAPRYYYAMAREGMFIFSSKVGSVHPRYGTPTNALIASSVWSSVIVILGNFKDLINLTVFVAWLFYLLTIGGLFVLRYKMPDLPRPYRAVGYPVVPLVGMAGAIWILSASLITNPRMSLLGLGVTLAGLPVYLILKRHKDLSGKAGDNSSLA